jgi:ubiquinone/menaquinone biosynthesis C-methylase UbiE
VEIDDELAATLRERFTGKPSIEIVHGDATRLAFADERFTGAACFMPTAELQDRLFAEVARVLHPGAALVASDSLGSEELAAAHAGVTYNPVDPATLPDRLEAAGVGNVHVRTNEFGWAVAARAR